MQVYPVQYLGFGFRLFGFILGLDCLVLFPPVELSGTIYELRTFWVGSIELSDTIYELRTLWVGSIELSDTIYELRPLWVGFSILGKIING